MKLNNLAHKQEVFESGDDSIFVHLYAMFSILIFWYILYLKATREISCQINGQNQSICLFKKKHSSSTL